MARQVFVKNFDHFTDRSTAKISGKHEWMNKMITSLNGSEWKKLRSTISPTFSTKKMKNMFTIIDGIIENFIKQMEEVSKDNEKVDVKECYNRFSLDVIGASAFGIECDTLAKDPVFLKRAAELFTFNAMKVIRILIFLVLPMKVINFLRIPVVDDGFTYFKRISETTLEQRRKLEAKRGDFIDLMLDEQEKQKNDFDEDKNFKICDDTILATSVLFIIAGNENIANLLTFSSYYLAKDETCQNTLRKEIEDIIEKDGELNYHNIMEAKYLDACLSETLRLNSVLLLERVCTKDFQFPGVNGLKIEKGSSVNVGIHALHLDPEYWPDPEKYNPERFLPENKHSVLPGTYLPFGIGPRNCIAMRFALMEAKICMAKMTMKFKLSLAPGHEELKVQPFTRAPIKGSVKIIMEPLE